MARKTIEMSGAKPEVNKTQLIKAYLGTNPDAKPKAAAADLQKQGYDIQPQAVSLVKHQVKKAAEATTSPADPFAEPRQTRAKKKVRGKKRAAKAPVAGQATTGDSISFESLRQAKELAAQLGGVAKAKAALDALVQLTS